MLIMRAAGRLIFVLLIWMPGLAVAKPNFSETKFRTYLTENYLDQYIKIYNSFHSPQEMESVLGNLWSPRQRKEVFAGWKHVKRLPRLHRIGSTLIIELPHYKPTKIQLLDVVQQRYVMNGHRWVHDWNGSAGTQIKVLQYYLTHGVRSARNAGPENLFPSPLSFMLSNFLQIFVPPAQAQFGEIVIPLAAVALVEEAPVIASEADAAAFYVQAEAPAIEAGAAEVSGEALDVAETQVSKAGGFVKRTWTWLQNDFGSNEALQTRLAKASKFAKNFWRPSHIVNGSITLVGLMLRFGRWLGAAAIPTALGVGGGAVAGVVYVPAIEKGNKLGLTWYQSVSCETHYGSVSHCPLVHIHVPVSKKEANIGGYAPRLNWCPTTTANEYQMYFVTDSTQEVYDIRIDSNWNPISATRFEVSQATQRDYFLNCPTADNNEVVRLNSVRQYVFNKNGALTKVVEPGFNRQVVCADELVTPGLLSPKNVSSKQMSAQILSRQSKLTKWRDKPHDQTKLDSKDITQYVHDRLRPKNLNPEFDYMWQLDSALTAGQTLCGAQAKLSAPPSSIAPTVAPPTPAAPPKVQK